MWKTEINGKKGKCLLGEKEKDGEKKGREGEQCKYKDKNVCTRRAGEYKESKRIQGKQGEYKESNRNTGRANEIQGDQGKYMEIKMNTSTSRGTQREPWA